MKKIVRLTKDKVQRIFRTPIKEGVDGIHGQSIDASEYVDPYVSDSKEVDCVKATNEAIINAFHKIHEIDGIKISQAQRNAEKNGDNINLQNELNLAKESLKNALRHLRAIEYYS